MATSGGGGGFDFQTFPDLVISLDLTKIIAFDAFRELPAHPTRCRVPEVGRHIYCVHVGNKARASA